MQLCGAAVSPYFERCALVVQHKGTPEDIITVGGMPCAMKSPEHFGFNPTGKIPFLLLDDGSSLIESQIIAEFLNESLEGPSLLPDDPEGRARVRLICRLVDLYLAPIFEKAWANRGHPEEERRRAVAEDMPKAWQYIEAFIADTGFAYGNDWTLADYALIPWIFHLRGVAAQLGEWEPKDHPNLQAWFAGAGSSELAVESATRSRESYQRLFGGK